MRGIRLISLLFVISNISSYSQISIGTNIGYSFQLTGQNLEEGNHFKKSNIDIVSNSKSLLGTGLLTSIWIDYSLFKFLSFKVQYKYLNNLTSSVDRQIFDYTRNSLYKSDASSFTLSLGIKDEFKSLEYILYIGADLTFNNKMTNMFHQDDRQFNFTNDDIAVFTDRFGFGISSEIQFLYHFKFKNKLFIGSVIGINYSTFSPDKSEVTSSVVNGIETIESLTINEKEAIYKENYFLNMNEPINPNLPQTLLKQYYNRSAITTSVVIGIKF